MHVPFSWLAQFTMAKTLNDKKKVLEDLRRTLEKQAN
jgi:hypothetical protein